ncbi:MAG TPA: alpha/beta hydrolase [Nevskia sp.]|jgi:non-heme chloroperoxidase|nr:alpha/beta hydrolase [Nevskia sp.]
MSPFKHLAALCLLAVMAPPAQAAAKDQAVRDNTFTTGDSVHIHYLEAGKAGSAPALVLIPGWTLSASLWREQLQAFSGERLVIAVDSRSQGASDKTVQGNTPERRATDLHELLAARHIERIVLVGWSQGAQDVAAYIRQYGTGSLAGVAFVDSPVSAGPEEVTLNPGFSKAILSGLSVYANHPAEYSEGMVRSIFALPHPEPDIQHIIELARGTPPQTGMAMLLSDIFGVDRRDALGKIDRPALVIASAKSQLLDQQKAMAAAIAGASLVVVQDAGHAVFVDQPEQFDQALGALLSAAGKPGS